ncbi:MAG: glycogen-binding domain-containing protein [Elusimicrobia bacterium]|nr:glycogen-binding domain-containing protein [Elusimicrobiota bacterium]
MLKKILLWVGFIIGIVIVAFPSLMLVERIRGFINSKTEETPKQEIAQNVVPVKEENVKISEELTYPKITGDSVIFQYKSDNAQKVFVAGTFNNWDGKKGTMIKNAGIWSTTVQIKPGKYFYKFKVDGIWYLDPKNPVSADDGKGGRVSVLIVEK